MSTRRTFKDCLEYERSQQELADTFLKQVYSGNTIYRPLWSDPTGRELQKADIDVVLRHTDPNTNWPMEWTISEKFRNGTWPSDLYIELYSDFKKKHKGWGRYSQAKEYHMYYKDGDNVSVRVVPVWGVKKLCKEIKWLYDPILKTMDEQKQNHCEYLYKGETIILRFDPTYGGGSDIPLWKNAAVIIPLDVFKYINCKITQYNLVKGEWKLAPDCNITF